MSNFIVLVKQVPDVSQITDNAFDPETGKGGGSLLTLSYYGAEKVIPHYNVMGVAKAPPQAAAARVRVASTKQGGRRARHAAVAPLVPALPMGAGAGLEVAPGQRTIRVIKGTEVHEVNVGI